MIVLDTHVWLWWINQSTKLKSIWQTHIERDERVCISAISLFEVAWLDQHNRIQLPFPRLDWFEKALLGSNIELLPITPKIANQAVNLPEHHSDLQDRLIIAAAIVHDALLLSADDKFKLYTELGNKLIR